MAKVIKERAEMALRDANLERGSLRTMVAEKEQAVVELRSALALLHLAMDQIKSTVWAMDKTRDRGDLAVAAHLAAPTGRESEVRLQGEFSQMFLRVVPLREKSGSVSV